MSCRNCSSLGDWYFGGVGLILVCCVSQVVEAAEQKTEWFTQKPEIARTIVRIARQTGGSPPAKPNADDVDESSRPSFSDRDQFQVPEGFQVELLYTVPKETQGSWVNMTFDDRGRILASDQNNKGLYRIVPPRIESSQETRVEKLKTNVTSAQGLLYAFNSLYVSVNSNDRSGLYRLRDTDGDDTFDEETLLKRIEGAGEHGVHAIRLSPDSRSLYLVCGNHTDIPSDFFDASSVPSNWGEDLLLPRQWDARGHARGRMAPGGWVCRTDPDGKSWEVVSIGYRNVFDMDFNADGELFVYDADMEWDMGMPWYRPTRVNHVTSGSEFGWRSGTGKWPTYYVDSLPQVVDIGPGSPVGVTFGYGARFPEKYQRALYLLDWTFGTIYTVKLTPHGASYVGEKEEFLTRAALPLTDAAIGPDGGLYFTVGGRQTQSALYRVTYVGEEPVTAVDARDRAMADVRQVRRSLEVYHRPAQRVSETLDFIWPHLGHQDRHIRYAARTAIEHQPVEKWAERALQESDPQRQITALVALARQGNVLLQPRLLEVLEQLELPALPVEQQLEVLRVYALIFIRMGEPDRPMAQYIASRLEVLYPAPSNSMNAELSRLLVYLKSPVVIDKTLAQLTPADKNSTGTIQTRHQQLLTRNENFGKVISQMDANPPPPPQALHYAFVLRNLRFGWTLDQRQEYFHWLNEARTRSGGECYEGFIDNIRKDALENVTDDERKLLDAEVVDPLPINQLELPQPIGPGKTWTVDAIVRLTEEGLVQRNFEQGRQTYAAAKCVLCHRFSGQGGNTAPDLTNAAGRFSFRDLADATIHPSRVVSDQYRATVIHTESGKTFQGRIVAEDNEQLTVATDPYNGREVEIISKAEVEQRLPAKVSLMPDGLLNTLNEQELLDLLAFLMSRGDADDPMFNGGTAPVSTE